jgi:hypothetical protein
MFRGGGFRVLHPAALRWVCRLPRHPAIPPARRSADTLLARRGGDFLRSTQCPKS